MRTNGTFFLIEMLLSSLPFIWGVEKRRRPVLRALIICAILLGAFFPMQYYVEAITGGITEHIIRLYDIIPGLLFLYFFLYLGIIAFCKVSAAEAAYIFSLSYTLEHIIYCIRLLSVNGEGTPFFRVGSIQYFLLHALMGVICYFSLAKELMDNGHYIRRTWDTVFLTAVVLGVVLLMSNFATEYDYEQIHAIYAIAICSFVFVNEHHVKKWQEKQMELSAKEMLWNQAKNQYTFSKETMESVHKTYHDLKHQLDAIKAMEASPERDKIIGDLQESADQYEAMFHTGNEVLDTVLTEKKLLAAKNNIEMVCMVDSTLLAQIPIVDMYRIMGNAIDNAIEANLRITDASSRFIEVKVFSKLGLDIIQIENPSIDRTPLDSIPKESTKREKTSHGYGLNNIRELVEKNGGFIKVQQKDYLFILRIAFGE